MNLDISAYCSKEINCSCGRRHFCSISDVIIRNGALDELPGLLKEYDRIFLVADTNTHAVCGEKAEALLNGRLAGSLVYQRDGHLVPDERAVAELTDALPESTDLILGVGSGVINDVCKYVSRKQGLECAIVATAPSMDGYASSGAAMITDGMKVTYTTHPPKYILADVDVVKQAPMDMIRAGYGDIIGKYSSLNDWKLSHLINGEYFCQEIYGLVLEVTNNIRDSAAQIVARNDGAIEYLTKALVLIGITLSLVESTRPGSGSEHHLSHFFEIVGLVHGQPHFVHGADVAYNTVLTAGMREQICRQQAPLFRTEAAPRRTAAWERIFGSVAPEVKQLQQKAGSYEKNLEPVYRAKWQEILEILSECPTAAQCSRMMEAVGFDFRDQERMYGHEKICDAMLYGKDLKDRYSVLWIYYALFSADPAAADYRNFSLEEEG